MFQRAYFNDEPKPTEQQIVNNPVIETSQTIDNQIIEQPSTTILTNNEPTPKVEE
jgi:hypothetical protein